MSDEPNDEAGRGGPAAGGADGDTVRGGPGAGPDDREAGRGGGSPLGRTAVGFVAGGLLFLGLGVYLNVATGYAPTDNAGPLSVLVLIGATVGGLVAPLLSSLVRRFGGDGESR